MTHCGTCISFQRTGSQTEKALAPVFLPIFQPFLTKTPFICRPQGSQRLVGCDHCHFVDRQSGALPCRALKDSKFILNCILHSIFSQCSDQSKGVAWSRLIMCQAQRSTLKSVERLAYFLYISLLQSGCVISMKFNYLYFRHMQLYIHFSREWRGERKDCRGDVWEEERDKGSAGRVNVSEIMRKR